jgi:hypothetical protein
VEAWEPWDDATAIMVALMNLDARIEDVANHVVAIHRILEDCGQEEED